MDQIHVQKILFEIWYLKSTTYLVITAKNKTKTKSIKLQQIQIDHVFYCSI